MPEWHKSLTLTLYITIRMSKVYDFIIIGCGPTGSTAATKLARLGYSVIVFEKTKFPRMHEGESLLPFCYPVFEELGVLDEMKKNFVRKPGARFSSHDGVNHATWCFKTVIHDDSFLSFNVERARFDHILMKNARKNGAEVLEETKVESVDFSGPDKIVEVVTANAAGERNTWHTKFIIDASGQDTFIAKRMGSKRSYKELDRVAWLGHWKNGKMIHGLDVGLINIVYLETSKKGWFALQSIAKNLHSVTLVVDRAYMKEQKKKITDEGIENWQREFYEREIENCAVAKEVLGEAEMEDRFLIVSDYSYFADKMYGENYALLGDAYKYLDPIFSTGVYLGMKSGMLFAETIHEKLNSDKANGDQKMEELYKTIDGAYGLVEKFINVFYDPNSLNLSEVSSKSESNYEGYESAMGLIHYLLSGDFFRNYDKYANFLDMIRVPEQYKRWRNLVQDRMDPEESTCGMTWDQIFGDIIDPKTEINIEA